MIIEDITLCDCDYDFRFCDVAVLLDLGFRKLEPGSGRVTNDVFDNLQ